MKAIRYNKKILEELQNWERIQISKEKTQNQVAKELRELLIEHEIVNLKHCCDDEFIKHTTTKIFYPNNL